jgi:hypothetical protein
VPKKIRTRDQVAAMKDKAVRFLRDVVGDPDRAQEFEEMDAEDYAEHKHIQIENPSSRTTIHKTGVDNMPLKRTTRSKLQKRIDELESENEALTDKLDSILDIASDDEDDDAEEDDD